MSTTFKMFLKHGRFRSDLKEEVWLVKPRLDLLRTYQVFSDFKNDQGWEWFWKRVEDFSDQSALVIRDRAHTSTLLPGTDFNTVFDIIQAKVMTLDCQDVRPADEELCVYLSAIMTWLLLPANSICSLIPTLVSYDDFVRESDFDTGPRVCHARWYHAQMCVRHLVDKLSAEYLFGYYNLLQRNDVQSNFNKFLRAHLTPNDDELDGRSSLLVLNETQLKKSSLDAWLCENTTKLSTTLITWAKQNSRSFFMCKCDWRFLRYLDNAFCSKLERLYEEASKSTNENLITETQELLSAAHAKNAQQEFVVCFLQVFAKKYQVPILNFEDFSRRCFKQALQNHIDRANLLLHNFRDRQHVRHTLEFYRC
jgi:hypothetical protein